MKRISLTILTLFLIQSAYAQYDNWAAGFKLGEPTGVNIRKYFNNVNALDLTVGTYGGILGNERKYRSGKYENVGLSVQLHYLWHTPLFGSETFHIYYGLGGQVNSRKYYPDSKKNATPASAQYEKTVSIGGSLLGGFEYFLRDNRVSVFLEGGGYVELIPGIFHLAPNLSGGVRLNL